MKKSEVKIGGVYAAKVSSKDGSRNTMNDRNDSEHYSRVLRLDFSCLFALFVACLFSV
ncbi:MAG: hypothetical protein ACYTG0_17885 [Planctomycetota bacterium]